MTEEENDRSDEISLPDNHWLKYGLLPPGTVFGVRQDLAYEDRFFHTLTGAAEEAAGEVFQEQCRYPTTVGHKSVYQADYENGDGESNQFYFNIGMMSWVMVPAPVNGRFIVNFPWGQDPSEYDISDFQEDDNFTVITVEEAREISFGPLSYSTPEEVDPSDFSSLERGDIVLEYRAKTPSIVLSNGEEGVATVTKPLTRPMTFEEVAEQEARSHPEFPANYGSDVETVAISEEGRCVKIGTLELQPCRWEDFEVKTWAETTVGDIVLMPDGRFRKVARCGQRRRVQSSPRVYSSPSLDTIEEAREVDPLEAFNTGGRQRPQRSRTIVVVEPSTIELPSPPEGVEIVTDGVDLLDLSCVIEGLSENSEFFEEMGITTVDPFASRNGYLSEVPENSLLFNSYFQEDNNREGPPIVETLRTDTRTGTFDGSPPPGIASWAISPTYYSHDEPMVLIKSTEYGVVAVYYPLKNTIECPLKFFMMVHPEMEGVKQFFDFFLSEVMELTSEFRGESREEAIRKIELSKKLSEVFGRVDLSDLDNIVVGGKVGTVLVEEPPEGEHDATLTLSFPDGGSTTMWVSDTRSARSSLKQAVNTIIEGEEAVKAIVQERVEADIQEFSTTLENDLLRPTIEEAESHRSRAQQVIDNGVARLQNEVNSAAENIRGIEDQLAYYSKVTEFVKGVIQNILPNGNWRVRVNDDGYVDACLDSVTWVDDHIRHSPEVTTPIMLRVRIYHHAETDNWMVKAWSENPYALTEMNIHPHISTGRSFNDIREEHHDSYRPTGLLGTVGVLIKFCFGRRRVDEPTHSNLIQFANSLKEYLEAIDGVMRAVNSPSGYGPGITSPAYYQLSGYGTTNLSDEVVFEDVGQGRSRIKRRCEEFRSQAEAIAEEAGVELPTFSSEEEDDDGDEESEEQEGETVAQ